MKRLMSVHRLTHVQDLIFTAAAPGSIPAQGSIVPSISFISFFPLSYPNKGKKKVYATEHRNVTQTYWTIQGPVWSHCSCGGSIIFVAGKQSQTWNEAVCSLGKTSERYSDMWICRHSHQTTEHIGECFKKQKAKHTVLSQDCLRCFERELEW